MRHRMFLRIVLILALAMRLPSALFAMAEAPEILDIALEEIELPRDGEGDDLSLDGGEVILEGEDLILDDGLDGLDDVLVLDEVLALQLSEEELPELTDEVDPGLRTDAIISPDGVKSGSEETLESVTAAGGMDNDALFEAWMKRALPGMGALRDRGSALSGRASLDGLSLKLYDALVPMIREVAEGKRTSTELTIDDAAIGLTESWWTAGQLGLASLDDASLGKTLLVQEGFDQKKIMQALLADCPYDLYWFNKSTGGGMGWSFGKQFKNEGDVRYARLTAMTARLSVAADYARSGVPGTYEVNDLPARVSSAVSNINSIVSDNADKGDLDKLRAYANSICGLVAYNSDAAANPNTPYGDPWQLVYIFDGAEDTKVVCEGYSKGFKYLCDLSDFGGDVYCELMGGTIPAGDHMWNALRMPDGRCYLVDLTNSDGGDACNEKYFLKGCSGQTGGPYTCGELTYTLSDNTRAILSDSWLTLSGADYGRGYAVSASAEHGAVAVDPAVADAGATVTLTLTAEVGYVAARPAVRFGQQNLSLQQAGDQQWRFTMPHGDVSVVASFTCAYAVQGFEGEYDGQLHGISVTSATGTVTYGIASDACDLDQSPVWRDAGTYTVYYSIGPNNAVKGEAKVVIATKTVNLIWADACFIYDGDAHAPAATATDFVPGDSCDVTVTGAGRDVGSYTATATGLSNDNYALTGNLTQAFTIAPREVELDWSDTEFTYDGDAHAPTATATGLVPGDSCDVTVTGAGRDAGSYTATATGLSNGNYVLPEAVNRPFDIAPRKVGLKWSKTTLTYNRKAQKPVATATGLVPGDACTVTVTGARKNAGSYRAKASKLSNANYALPEVRTKAYRIKKKTIRLKWAGTRLKYNGKYQKPTATAIGVIRGDRCSVTVSGAKKKKGVYTAEALRLSNGNYQLPAKATVRFRIY